MNLDDITVEVGDDYKLRNGDVLAVGNRAINPNDVWNALQSDEDFINTPKGFITGRDRILKNPKLSGLSLFYLKRWSGFMSLVAIRLKDADGPKKRVIEKKSLFNQPLPLP